MHDIGQVGIPSGIWDRPGALSAAQWERVRSHPYLSERVLRRCACSPRSPTSPPDTTSAPTGPATTAASPTSRSRCRLLAAADVYHALTEDRPHRPAHGDADAAALLRAERRGRFGGREVDAVLEAAGETGLPAHAAPGRAHRSGGRGAAA